MTRNVLNFVIDIATTLIAAAMVATGLLIRFVLPPGSGSRRLLWGYGRHEWGDIHFWLAVAIAGIVILHVALHWQWVCTMFARIVPGRTKQSGSSVRRNSIGAAVMVCVAALFIGLVYLAKNSVSDNRSAVADGNEREFATQSATGIGHAERERGNGGTFIQGSMTLDDVAQKYGISVEVLRSRLNLHADEPADERLGRLSKKYGFSMQDARDKLNQELATNK